MSPVLAILSQRDDVRCNQPGRPLFTDGVFRGHVPTRRVVVGQYLAFAAIVLMSMTAAWALKVGFGFSGFCRWP
jgi:hypothetical protein